MSPGVLVLVSTSKRILVPFPQLERSGQSRKHLGNPQNFAVALFMRHTTRKRVGQYILYVYKSTCLLLARCRGERTGRASSAFRLASVAVRNVNQLRQLPYNMGHGPEVFLLPPELCVIAVDYQSGLQRLYDEVRGGQGPFLLLPYVLILSVQERNSRV